MKSRSWSVRAKIRASRRLIGMVCSYYLSRKCSALLVVGAFVLGGTAGPLASMARAAPAPQQEQIKSDEKTKAQNLKDLKALQEVFGNNPVTIFYGAVVESVRIIDVIEVFGKQYLRVQKKDGKPMLIRADLITVIRED